MHMSNRLVVPSSEESGSLLAVGLIVPGLAWAALWGKGRRLLVVPTSLRAGRLPTVSAQGISCVSRRVANEKFEWGYNGSDLDLAVVTGISCLQKRLQPWL